MNVELNSTKKPTTMPCDMNVAITWCTRNKKQKNSTKTLTQIFNPSAYPQT